MRSANTGMFCRVGATVQSVAKPGAGTSASSSAKKPPPARPPRISSQRLPSPAAVGASKLPRLRPPPGRALRASKPPPALLASSMRGLLQTSSQGLICDAPSTASAALLLYDGSGISYSGMQLSCTQPGDPAVFDSTVTTSAMVAAPPGTILTPSTPYSLPTSSNGSFVTVDNFTSVAYSSAPGQNGSALPQLFSFTSTTDPFGPILPGETMLVTSEQTGMYCRATATTPAGMVCDVSNPAFATNFTWTGTTITYNGAPLSAVTTSSTIAPPTGSPVSFTNTTGTTPIETQLPGPSIPALQPISIGTSIGGCLAVNNATSPVYTSTGNCTGSSTTQQFKIRPATGGGSSIAPGTPIQPGAGVIIESVETGMYCRVAVVDGGQGLLCDVTDPALATPVTYTGSGLSYGGLPLESGAPGAPLVVSPVEASTSYSSSGGTTMVFQPAAPSIAPGGSCSRRIMQADRCWASGHAGNQLVRRSLLLIMSTACPASQAWRTTSTCRALAQSRPTPLAQPAPAPAQPARLSPPSSTSTTPPIPAPPTPWSRAAPR
jgi:hypothetical protein